MFALKAPLVERIVASRITASTAVMFPKISAMGSTRDERRQQHHQRLFTLRRDLWTKSVPELKAEIDRNQVTKAVLSAIDF